MKTMCCIPQCENHDGTGAMFAVLDPDSGDEFHICFMHMKAILNRYEFLWRRTNEREQGIHTH